MRSYVLWALLRKEVAAGWASPRFQLSAWLIVLLSMVVSVAAAEEHASRLALWKLLRDESEKSLPKARTWSRLSPVVLRAPEPLALFAQGFDARLGREVAIRLFSVPRQLDGDYRGNDFAVQRYDLDLTTVVGVVLGFSALLLTFDAFTQERERRTGKHLAAAGVAPGEVFLAKYLGLGFLLSLPLGLAVASSLALFVRLRLLPLDSSTLPRLGSLFATYEIYLSLLVLLGLTASLVSAGSSRALSRLLFVWLVFFLAVPAVALNLRRDDVPQRRAEREVERRLAEREAADKARLEGEEERDPLLGRFDGRHSVFQEPDPEDWHVRFVRYGSAPFYDATLKLVATEVERGLAAAEEASAVRRGLAARRRDRERLAKWVSFASPSYVFDRTAEAFAGTAADDHDRFLAACQDYRMALLGHLKGKEAWATWRWLTDDTPETLRPWPSFFGKAAEDVPHENRSAAVQRLNVPPASTSMFAHIEEANLDHRRLLPVEDLPRFSYTRPGWDEAARRVWPELSWNLALHLGLLAVAFGWLRGGRDVFGTRA